MNNGDRVAIRELQVKMDDIKELLINRTKYIDTIVEKHSNTLSKLLSFKSKQEIINTMLGFVSGALVVAMVNLII